MNQWNRTRLKIKFYFDLIANEKIKVNLLQALPFWIASLLTGLMAVLYTKLFTLSESLRRSLLYNHGWIIFILTPVCFFIAWWVVVKFSQNARGSGITQVMTEIEIS